MAKRTRDDVDDAPPAQVARIDEILEDEFATLPSEMREAIEAHLAIRPLLRHASAGKRSWGDVERSLRIAIFAHIVRNVDWAPYNSLTEDEKNMIKRWSAGTWRYANLTPEEQKTAAAAVYHIAIFRKQEIPRDFLRLFVNYCKPVEAWHRLQAMSRAELMAEYREPIEALVKSMATKFRLCLDNLKITRYSPSWRIIIFPSKTISLEQRWWSLDYKGPLVPGALCEIILRRVYMSNEVGAFTSGSDPRIEGFVNKFRQVLERATDDNWFFVERSSLLLLDAFTDLLFNFLYDISPTCTVLFQNPAAPFSNGDDYVSLFTYGQILDLD